MLLKKAKKLIISILHILIWTESQKNQSAKPEINNLKEHMGALVGKLT